MYIYIYRYRYIASAIYDIIYIIFIMTDVGSSTVAEHNGRHKLLTWHSCRWG